MQADQQKTKFTLGQVKELIKNKENLIQMLEMEGKNFNEVIISRRKI